MPLRRSLSGSPFLIRRGGEAPPPQGVEPPAPLLELLVELAVVEVEVEVAVDPP
jgi:hypothetical protein